MRRSLIRDFVMFPDILWMSLLMVCGWVITLLHAAHGSVWIAIVMGMLAYAITEYTTHRFLFHMKPPKNSRMLRFLKRIHYDHHADPEDLHLLFLPLWYSLPNMAIATAICYWMVGSWVVTVAFCTGIGTFLLYYEWTHYVAHRPIQPKTTWGRKMKKIHLWHHFKNENYWYGVTHPAMDVVLGTFKDEKSVPRSQTAKDLEHRYPNGSIEG